MHPNQRRNGHRLSTKLADANFGAYIRRLANLMAWEFVVILIVQNTLQVFVSVTASAVHLM